MKIYVLWDAEPKPHGQKPQGIFFSYSSFNTLLKIEILKSDGSFGKIQFRSIGMCPISNCNQVVSACSSLPSHWDSWLRGQGPVVLVRYWLEFPIFLSTIFLVSASDFFFWAIFFSGHQAFFCVIFLWAHLWSPRSVHCSVSLAS